MIRRAAWAGQFYEYSAEDLRRSIEECFLSRLGPGRLPSVPEKRTGQVLGIVSPHAGYVYSGPGAANAFCALAEDGLPRVAVIIGPKHRYGGADVAVDTSEAWATPLGTVAVDQETCQAILQRAPFAEADPSAHAQEHSLEVQVPFLQFVGGEAVSIAPIAVGLPPYGGTARIARELGLAIADAIRDRDAVVIASTDLTHYESETSAKEKDSLAIAAIENLDAEDLLKTVSSHGISMCGAVPTAVAIEACRALGASRAELLSYFSSGETTGDRSSVVAYGALKIVRG